MSTINHASPPPFILVDGSYYLYRAFHAMSKANLRNADGEPTGAVRGVIYMLSSIKESYPGSNITVIFDSKGKTFRNDIYPEYKAQRTPMPKDLRSQMQPIYEIIHAMGLSILSIAGVEADDVIGTLAHQLTTKKGAEVVISTGDKDMSQLVNHHITLVNTMTGIVLDINGVQNKFGLPPELIIDYLALMGDKVDNIPGVPGIGKITSLCLLQNFCGLNKIYKNLKLIRSLRLRGAKGMPEKLSKNKHLAELSYILATIKCDVMLNLHIDELVNRHQDNEKIINLFNRMNLGSLIMKLSS